MGVTSVCLYIRYFVPFVRARDTAKKYFDYYTEFCNLSEKSDDDLSYVFSAAYKMREHAFIAQELYRKLKGREVMNEELTDIVIKAEEVLKFRPSDNRKK